MAEREFFSGKILYPTIVALLALSMLFGLMILPRLFHGSHPLVGHEAPDFALEVVYNGAAGDRIHLAELKGHPVILDFWATWCAPCRAEAPILDRVSRKHKERGLVVVGINTNDADERLAPLFAKQTGLSYPIVRDADDRVAGLYGVVNLPTLVIIDTKGSVIAVRSGLEDDGELDRLVNQAN
jgi:cytochrome c biogenesis protein CcmG, thiol:disulfide interchange protein DsbE